MVYIYSLYIDAWFISTASTSMHGFVYQKMHDVVYVMFYMDYMVLYSKNSKAYYRVPMTKDTSKIMLTFCFLIYRQPFGQSFF